MIYRWHQVNPQTNAMVEKPCCPYLPVLPQITTRSPGLMRKLISFRARFIGSPSAVNPLIGSVSADRQHWRG